MALLLDDSFAGTVADSSPSLRAYRSRRFGRTEREAQMRMLDLGRPFEDSRAERLDQIEAIGDRPMADLGWRRCA